MVYRYRSLLLLSFIPFTLADATEKIEYPSDDSRLAPAFELLSRTASGRDELKKALELKIKIALGPVSKTDITATRIQKNDKETLEFQTQIIVASDKEPVFQALDLAHELVHATHPKKNPFDPGLNLSEYVKQGIEGDGGEAQAIAEECSVGKELIEDQKLSLAKNETANVIRARCQFVWQTASDHSRWTKSFYQMGQHYREFMKTLARLGSLSNRKTDWENKVEPKSPLFSSAVAHKPYPLALLEEYVDITSQICERSKKSGVNRKIASLPLLAERCKSVGVDLNP